MMAVRGVLNVESTQGEKPKGADLRRMTTLGEHISIANGRARLYAAARASIEQYLLLPRMH